MYITYDYLEGIDACHKAKEWFLYEYPEGAAITRESLESCPEPEWLWWLACRLETSRYLVHLPVAIAMREVESAHEGLANNPVGDYDSIAHAAASIADVADCAARAAGYAMRAMTDADDADAYAANATDAARAAAEVATWDELRETAIDFLLSYEGGAE